MASRIILCGASSVGKTTMATQWCKEHKQYYHIQEVARDVMKEHKLTRKDMEESLKGDPKKGVFLDLQRLILKAQNQHELKIPSGKPYISDRGPDPIVFAYVYGDADAAKNLAESLEGRQCLERYRKCLVALLCPLPTPTDDNFRFKQDMEQQQKFTDEMIVIFHQYKIPHVFINETNHEKRMRMLNDAVNGKLMIHHDRMLKDNSPVCIAFCTTKTPPSTSVYIRSLLISTGEIQCQYYPYAGRETDRMVHLYGTNKFVRLEFDKNVLVDTVIRFLTFGMYIDGEEYQFIGCSQSGIKKRHCYMFNGSVEDAEKVLAECGQFTAIKSTSKRLKRIALLFSKGMPTDVTIPEKDVKFVDDIETRNGNFTDGCGSISFELATAITKSAKLDLEEGYVPSVYQIRYNGCKGVVSVDPNLKQPGLILRKSMKKFESGTKPFCSVWLCGYSKPYSYGKLNKQFIMLLSGLGIDNQIFLNKQQQWFEMIETMTTSSEVAIKMFLWDNQPDLARAVVKYQSLTSNEHLNKAVHSLKGKYVEKLSKLSIFVEDSRYLFGVCDQLSILEYGQCFLRPIIRGKPYTIEGKVVIAKSPCYLLGDIRVLNAIDVPKLHHLVDCIVFPTKGKQPHPNEIAGSDLDGDEYFVCWDEQLIPCKLREPYDYPPVENRDASTTTREVMISYLSKQNQSMMGKIDANFQRFANSQGIGCTECEQLGKLFSRSVDSTKTGDVVKIPKHLQCPTVENKHEKAAQKVWMIMQNIAEEKRKELANKIYASEVSACSENDIWYLVQESLEGDEYKLFTLVQQWCRSQYSNEEESLNKLMEFAQCINFGKMSIHERTTVMDAGIPVELVTNALNWSNLLTSEMLSHFSMQSPHCGWHCFLSSSTKFQWVHLMKAVQKYKESFVVIDLGDGLISAIHFSCTLSLGESEVIPGSITAYFFSSHFNFKEQHILGKNYYVNLEDGVLQLYRNGKKAQTFIWLGSEAKSNEREIVFDRMSIDLQTYRGIKNHPKVNKQSFHSIEVFVRDVSGIPTYFDIYYAQESAVDLDHSPEIEVDGIDELPDCSDKIITQKINLPKSDTIDNYLKVLKQISMAGNCRNFSEALQIILSHKEFSPLAHSSTLCTCLNVLLAESVTKNVHKMLQHDEIEIFQIILDELQTLITDPLEYVKLLSSLSCLKAPTLLQQVVSSVLPHVQLNSMSSFMNICLSWKSWYFIPLEIALELLKHLFILHQSMISIQGKSLSKDNCTILELATNKSSHTNNDPVLLMHYSSRFAYLSLNHLLHEMTNKREVTFNKNEDTGHNLTRLSADGMFVDEEDDRQANCRVSFHRSKIIRKTSISKYTWVSINLMTKESDKIISTPVAIGKVINVTKTPACIDVDVQQPVPNCLMQSIGLKVSKCHWELCDIGNITAFSRAMKCLNDISNGQVSTTIVSLLVHPSGFHDKNECGFSDEQVLQETTKPLHAMESFTSTQNTLPSSPSLNFSQQKAIEAAITQRLTLIHGPPGTGKTLLACQIVRLFCDQLQDKEHILVTAETNMAVDNLTRKLLDCKINVVRVGRRELISDDIHHVTFEHERYTSEARSVMRSTQVIATTCTGAGDSALKGLSFPYVIIDEATQVTEPNSLIPLMNSCQQLILIGDPEQLSPTLLAFTPEDDGSELPQVKQLTQTLFHRLQKVLPSYFLNEQYRMHPMIAKFPSTKFYGGKLDSAQLTKERAPITSALFNKPVMFINAPSKETQCGRSYKNEGESDVVSKLAAQLIEDNINPRDIGILTPYAAQVISIKEHLTIKSIEVCTIDAFQGREKDVIIFSTVRCNSHGSLRFIDDKYRMNVLLTRAKRGILGVGCEKTLSSLPLWKEWLQQSEILSIDKLSSVIAENSCNSSNQRKGASNNVSQKRMNHEERFDQQHLKKHDKKQGNRQRKK